MPSVLERGVSRVRPAPRPMGLALRLLALVAPYRWWFALAVLLGFATVGSSVGLIATSAYLIARAALMPPLAALSVAVVGVRFFGIARALLRYAERYVSHAATLRLVAGVRSWFYAAVEPLAPAGLSERRSGDLLAGAVADVETLEQFYLRVLAPPLVALLAALLTAGLMLAFDGRLAVTLLLLQVLAGGAVPLLTRRLSRRPARVLVATRAELSATLVEGMQGLPDLLALGGAERWLGQVRRQGAALAAAQERLAAIRALASALVVLLSHLGAVAALLIVTPLVGGGRLDGVFVALIALTALASFEAVAPMAAAVQSLEQSLAAAGRLFAIADAPPPLTAAGGQSPTPEDSSLELRGVSFRYPGAARPALENLSLAVAPGRLVAIVGPSGAGKSTLLHLLARFWEYDAGSIRLGGHELRSYHPEDARRLIGLVAQQTHLFNGTVRDNLLLARPEASDGELADACRRAQLDEVIARLPEGLDTRIGEQGLKLSGGERQRLAIARALLKDAPILLLDEPTAHLDALSEGAVLAALAELTRGRTTLLITHRLRGLEQTDTVLVIDGGTGEGMYRPAVAV